MTHYHVYLGDEGSCGTDIAPGKYSRVKGRTWRTRQAATKWATKQRPTPQDRIVVACSRPRCACQ